MGRYHSCFLGIARLSSASLMANSLNRLAGIRCCWNSPAFCLPHVRCSMSSPRPFPASSSVLGDTGVFMLLTLGAGNQEQLVTSTPFHIHIKCYVSGHAGNHCQSRYTTISSILLRTPVSTTYKQLDFTLRWTANSGIVLCFQDSFQILLMTS